MIAEILATGDEIRSGALVDSNSAHIASELEAAGVAVARHLCVGDDLDVLTAAIEEIAARAAVAVATGGLGPTEDDLTADAAARAAGVSLVLNETALSDVEAFFTSRGREMGPSNRKQAMLPDGATMIANPVGTAPGFSLNVGDCLFFFVPGVPFEMKRMMADAVLPAIKSRFGKDRETVRVKTLSTFGLPESATGEKLSGFESAFPELKLGLRAKFPEIQVKLYGAGRDEAAVGDLLESAAGWVRERLGSKLFSETGQSMEAAVSDLLRRNGATLAMAESCTGGLIAHKMTNVSGSSDYFLFSGVTYSNEAKMRVLGVSEKTLKQYGAVSEETAREMAVGARQAADATWAIATTGIAGPDGGTPDKPVGTVCIGIAGPDGVKAKRFVLSFPSRGMNKTVFAVTALDGLRRALA